MVDLENCLDGEKSGGQVGWLNCHCHDNYDGCQNPLLLVDRKVLRFEREEVDSEETFEMEEKKHALKQSSINQMYSAEIGVISKAYCPAERIEIDFIRLSFISMLKAAISKPWGKKIWSKSSAKKSELSVMVNWNEGSWDIAFLR